MHRAYRRCRGSGFSLVVRSRVAGRAVRDRLLDLPETTSVLRLSERTLYRLRASGQLEPVKIGRSLRYRESDVQAFIRNRARRSAGQAVAR